MKNNERVKFVADLVEAAKKRGCEVPKAAIDLILNDPKNMKVFRINPYKNAAQTISAARKLIQRREQAKKEMY